MLGHQPGERRSMLMKMRFLDAPGFLRSAVEQPLNVGAHALVDQRKQTGRRRIEAIVEVEDPVADVPETGVHALESRREFNGLSKLKGFSNHSGVGKPCTFNGLSGVEQ